MGPSTPSGMGPSTPSGMGAPVSYGIGEVASLAGISTRALRFYEEIGLLSPAREANGYRRYTTEDIDRLQEILLLRNLGFGAHDIGDVISSTAEERLAALERHLDALRSERQRLDELVHTVEMTIDHLQKGTPMNDRSKFEGMKRTLVEENEREHGSEVRECWGDETAAESNRKMLNLSEDEFERFQALGREINEGLEAAVQAGEDPTGPQGERVYAMHREWLGFTWGFYTPEAHKGLGEMYVTDERFTAYYDGDVAGCAAWLRDAINAHAR